MQHPRKTNCKRLREKIKEVKNPFAESYQAVRHMPLVKFKKKSTLLLLMKKGAILGRRQKNFPPPLKMESAPDIKNPGYASVHSDNRK